MAERFDYSLRRLDFIFLPLMAVKEILMPAISHDNKKTFLKLKRTCVNPIMF